MTLDSTPQFLEWHAARQPDAIAVLDPSTGQTVSYGELRRQARATALRLRALGLVAGDTVAIWLPNGLDWMVFGLAVHYLRGVVVPLNTRYQLSEAEYIIDKSDARLVIATSAFLGRDYAAEVRTAPVSRELLAVIDVLDPAYGVPGLEPGNAADEAFLDDSLAQIGPDDLSDIMFTSGTTGYPKGALITHGAGVQVVDAANRRMLIRPDDRQLIVNPFFHMFGYKYGWAYMLVLGGVVIPEPVFDARRAAQTIQDHRVSVYSGPPALFTSIMALPDRADYDLSSLSFSLIGTTNIDPAVIFALRSDLGIDRITTGYGLTESTATATFTLPDDDLEVLATTTGRAVDGIEIRTARPDGTDSGIGEAGEVLLRGFSVAAGYYKDPEATAATFDADGWLHTGDIGVFDEASNLAIVGRLKDMVIVGGFNVYPAEVERVLGQHAAVVEAAVIGVPDERLGEVPVAYVEGTADPAELLEWCRTRLANFKCPREIRRIEEFPRTPLGKIRKGDLRVLWATSAAAAALDTDSPAVGSGAGQAADS